MSRTPAEKSCDDDGVIAAMTMVRAFPPARDLPEFLTIMSDEYQRLAAAHRPERALGSLLHALCRIGAGTLDSLAEGAETTREALLDQLTIAFIEAEGEAPE